MSRAPSAIAEELLRVLESEADEVLTALDMVARRGESARRLACIEALAAAVQRVAPLLMEAEAAKHAG